MVPLFVSIAVMLVVLELMILYYGSRQSGEYAFISPKIGSSESWLVGPRLAKAMMKRDREGTRRILEEVNAAPREDVLWESISGVEEKLRHRFVEAYLSLLQYLPDDLRRFFEEARILWDIQNLKIIVDLVESRLYGDESFLGPHGYLSDRETSSLMMSSDLGALRKRVSEALPALAVDEAEEADAFRMSLETAGYEYLDAVVKEIGTSSASMAWNQLQRVYDLRNLSLTARLIHVGLDQEEITPRLFPFGRLFREKTLQSLAACRGYPQFLQQLGETKFGRELAGRGFELSRPDDVRRAFLVWIYEEVGALGITDIGVREAIGYMLSLWLEYDTVRDAFALIEEGAEA
ncbi:MAG: V-type ATPase subunit [Aigarchaeota archaeon]|nr:V-type ATPase subunit [Aigarchaeota archaeon]